MELIVFVYKKGKIKRLDITDKEWNRLPHGILKVCRKTDNGYIEYYGWGSYVLFNGEIGGIHQTKFSGKDIALENIIPDVPEYVKFGVTIPDEMWKEFHNKIW